MPPKKKLKIILQDADESPKRPSGTKGRKKTEKDPMACGGYTKVKYYGQGAYGEVWKATKGHKSYATKISTPAEIAPGVTMIDHSFIKEIDLLTRLKHPNVMDSEAEVYISKDQVCYFMPEAPTDFEKIFENRGKFDDLDPYDCFKKMLCGLAYLHANFVLHCDLKPENILYNPATKQVKLTDYGVSTIFGSTGKVKYVSSVVSASWRPPEFFALQSEKYIKGPTDYYFGAEIDVYSMGWIGMELLFDIRPPSYDEDEARKRGKGLHYIGLGFYEYLRSVGCNPGPLFSETFRGMFGGFSDWNVLQSDVNLLDQNDALKTKIGSVDTDYFERQVDVGQLRQYPPMRVIFDILVSMVRSPPLQRPTSRDLVNNFPEDLSSGKCQEITISYIPFSIGWTEAYSPENRSWSIDIMDDLISFLTKEIGKDNVDSVKLQSIDLLDRISMLLPPQTETEGQLNAAVAVYLAMGLLTSWGAEAELMIRRLNIQPSVFADRVSKTIYALKSRLYRPTLDQYGDMSAKQALEIQR